MAQDIPTTDDATVAPAVTAPDAEDRRAGDHHRRARSTSLTGGDQGFLGVRLHGRGAFAARP